MWGTSEAAGREIASFFSAYIDAILPQLATFFLKPMIEYNRQPLVVYLKHVFCLHTGAVTETGRGEGGGRGGGDTVESPPPSRIRLPPPVLLRGCAPLTAHMCRSPSAFAPRTHAGVPWIFWINIPSFLQVCSKFFYFCCCCCLFVSTPMTSARRGRNNNNRQYKWIMVLRCCKKMFKILTFSL